MGIYIYIYNTYKIHIIHIKTVQFQLKEDGIELHMFSQFLPPSLSKYFWNYYPKLFHYLLVI